MGADLCGAILVGPRKLGKRKLSWARREIKDAAEELKQLHLELTRTLEEPTDAEYETRMGQLIQRNPKFVRLRRIIRMSSNLFGIDEVFDAVDGLDDFLSDTGEHIVDQFEEVWDGGGGYRTVMIRRLPGDRTKQILVCADRTWGDPWDSYESNRAGWIITHMEWLGVLSLLGIE